MMWILGFVTGGAVVGIAWVLSGIKRVNRVHRAYIREWKRAQHGWRRKRCEAPLPLPIAKVAGQMQREGCCRMVRIGGEWR